MARFPFIVSIVQVTPCFGGAGYEREVEEFGCRTEEEAAASAEERLLRWNRIQYRCGPGEFTCREHRAAFRLACEACGVTGIKPGCKKKCEACGGHGSIGEMTGRRFRIVSGPLKGKIGTLRPWSRTVFGGRYGYPIEVDGVLFTFDVEQVVEVLAPRERLE